MPRRTFCGRRSEEERLLKLSTYYFCCDECKNKDFRPVYNFSLHFHSVNFSDDLIYDKTVDALYQCTKCLKTFSRREIEDKLAELKKLKKQSLE